MEQLNKSDNIILLFDTYSVESKNLHESFINSGINARTVVIETDGFLPDGVESVYEFFLGDFSETGGKPRYFNELEIPDFWEITSSNSSGKVMDMYKERARIFYAEPTNKRLIKIVDWLDEKGIVRLCEHYNKYGKLFCKTTFNKSGQKVSRSFFSAEGKETIVENYVTGDIIVTRDGKDKILRSKEAFISYFMKCAGCEQSKVFFNSLSFPFFASQALPDNGYKDMLFWSEDIADGIPGNMQIILNNQATRTRKIYVQKHKAYERLIELGANPDMVRELGYVYSYERENNYSKNILICTNSDQIEGLDTLVKELSDFHFHIAAITEMSARLHAFEANENVSLYPGAKRTVLDKLFEQCDYYLDINHEGEIADAVHRAFLNNMYIAGIRDFLHNPNYIAQENIFNKNQLNEMILRMKKVATSKEELKVALDNQKKSALSLSEQDFFAVLDK